MLFKVSHKVEKERTLANPCDKASINLTPKLHRDRKKKKKWKLKINLTNEHSWKKNQQNT